MLGIQDSLGSGSYETLHSHLMPQMLHCTYRELLVPEYAQRCLVIWPSHLPTRLVLHSTQPLAKASRRQSLKLTVTFQPLAGSIVTHCHLSPSQRHHFANKGLQSQSYGFSGSHAGM